MERVLGTRHLNRKDRNHCQALFPEVSMQISELLLGEKRKRALLCLSLHFFIDASPPGHALLLFS